MRTMQKIATIGALVGALYSVPTYAQSTTHDAAFNHIVATQEASYDSLARSTEAKVDSLLESALSDHRLTVKEQRRIYAPLKEMRPEQMKHIKAEYDTLRIDLKQNLELRDFCTPELQTYMQGNGIDVNVDSHTNSTEVNGVSAIAAMSMLLLGGISRGIYVLVNARKRGE
ncbi:MAG: hypothetical protein ABIA93_00295 [Candidatus Woesearchaeota archaeon]